MAIVIGSIVLLPFAKVVEAIGEDRIKVALAQSRTGDPAMDVLELELDTNLVAFVSHGQVEINTNPPIILEGHPGSPDRPIHLSGDPTHPLAGIPSHPVQPPPPLPDPPPGDELTPLEDEPVVTGYGLDVSTGYKPVVDNELPGEGGDKPVKPEQGLPGKPDDGKPARPSHPIQPPAPARPGGGPVAPPPKPTPKR